MECYQKLVEAQISPVLKDFSKTDELIREALTMIQALADNSDQEMMKRVAKSNFKSMSLTLRGHLV